MVRCRLIFLCIISWSALAEGQSLSNLISPYEVAITSHEEATEEYLLNQIESVLKDSRHFSFPGCDGIIVTHFNNRYTEDYPLPPHADMISLLANIASDSHNRVSQISTDDTRTSTNKNWVAEVHFAPSSYISDYAYGWMRTVYLEGAPLLHYIIFYDGERDSVEPYMIKSKS